MTPTRLLIGQIALVFTIVIGGVWASTQWTATMLGYRPRLGAPWFEVLAAPVYYPWRLFEWWYAYGAYAPELFDRAGMFAAGSGLLGCVVAIIGSFWRARQNQFVTTYGSSRWASVREVARANLFEPAGVFLGRLKGRYLRHDGPEHVIVKSHPTSTPPSGGTKPLIRHSDRKIWRCHGWKRNATSRIQLSRNKCNTLDALTGGVEVGCDFTPFKLAIASTFDFL